LNPVSATIICKNEESSIETCLKSIRPFVKELVIVDTGSTDKTPEIAKKYADIFEVYTDCNDENGDILNFSKARNRALELANYDIILWADGDDEVVGLENLSKYLAEYQFNERPVYLQFPYEYCYDESGKCTLVHYRERILLKKNYFQWVNPVHEICMSKDPMNTICINGDDIIWKHRRQYVQKAVKPNRNLRILEKWIQDNGEEADARQLYYIGLEYGNAGNLEKSKYYLNKYISLSGWDDEIYMAYLRLIEYDLMEKKWDDIIDHAFAAIKVKENWGEAYFALAKAYYMKAFENDIPKNWEKCINYAKIGLSLPPTKTLLFVNPMERDVIIHQYLNFALNKVGDMDGALESVETALKSSPNDKSLLLNKEIFIKEIAKRNLLIKIEEATKLKIINDKEENKIKNLINKLEIKEEQEIENLDLKSKAESLNDHQLKLYYLKLFKHLVLHDEIQNAEKILDIAPWQIRDSALIEQMRELLKPMLEHFNKDSSYNTLYAEWVPDREIVPLSEEIPPQNIEYPRFNYVLNKVKELKSKKENLTVLDVGCQYGQLTNRIGMLGVKAYGTDLNPHCINLARQRAIDFNTNAEYAVLNFDTDELPNNFPNKFDLVVACEVYEHVKDSKSFISKLSNYLNSDGSIIITSPYGSWCQGKDVPFSPKWDSLTVREHVRAPIPYDLKKEFSELGIENFDYSIIPVSQELLSDSWKVENQRTLCFTATKTESIKINDKLDIVFYMGQGLEPFNPETVKKTGIGGSENSTIELSKRLASYGHRVRVFNECGTNGEGIFDKVEWLNHDKYKNLNCDILMISRQSQALDDFYNIKSNKKYLISHDLHPKGMTPQYYDKVDGIFVLSNWHKQFILDTVDFIKEDKLIVLGNGIDPEIFNREVERDPFKIIVSSSPDRHLSSTLDIFEKVKAKVPQAKLTVCYGFKNWKISAEMSKDKGQLQLIKELQERLRKTNGVSYLGRLNQERLAEEYLSSGVWILPSWFQETNCIALSQAYLAGCKAISSPAGALIERNKDLGVVIEGDWIDPVFQEKFADAIIDAMHNTTEDDRKTMMNFARKELTWDKFAKDLEYVFKYDMIRYQPLNERN